MTEQAPNPYFAYQEKGGGVGSCQLPSLRADFPCYQGKYREFAEIIINMSELVL